MSFSIRLAGLSVFLAYILTIASGCRRDPTEFVNVPTDEEGGAGSGWTTQCSGWFPDWIAQTAPPSPSFQLSQGYPLGLPVIENVGGVDTITGWDPPSPASGSQAPWLAFDFHNLAERASYLAALKDYALDGMIEADFVAQNNTKRRWYHVPMMTTGPNPREGRRGLTAERTLRADEQSWLQSSVRSFGIGYYNSLGGYTIGQVFDDPEPSNSKPAKAQFIDGAFVSKILFAEYKPAAIKDVDPLGNPLANPLANSPQWTIQDRASPNGAGTVDVRLLQMDVAVKDPQAPTPGWVFATFVYDESLPAATPSDRWRNLVPLGLQWGNDPDVTGPGVGVLDESWIVDAAATPDAFEGHLGRDGRLIGPVDNPESACMSCHSTAQAYTPGTSLPAFKAVRFVPEGCTPSQQMHWFREISGSVAFDRMFPSPYCDPQNPDPTGLFPLDYSLQLQLGLGMGMGENTPNPCAALIPPEGQPGAVEQALEDALNEPSNREAARQQIAARAHRQYRTAVKQVKLPAAEIERMLAPVNVEGR